MACAITRFIQYSIQSHHEIAFEEKVQLKKTTKKQLKLNQTRQVKNL